MTRHVHALRIVVVMAGGAAIANACVPPPPVVFVPPAPKAPARVRPWPEADALFHQDPRWLGADAAFSVNLEDGRTLWLFGDTFIATSEAHTRKESVMIHNSVALQTGYDPSTATMSFGWRGDEKPEPLVADAYGRYFWPGQGIKIGKSLLLFYWYVAPKASGLGFEIEGWVAYRIRSTEGEPSDWKIDPVILPQQHIGGEILASSALFRDGFIEAYGFREPSHDVLVARWPASVVESADLSSPEWWTWAGWTRVADESPRAVLSGAETEFSLRPDRRHGGFLQVQTYGFGAATIGVRFAKNPLGPWSAPTQIYRPLESSLPHTLVYSAKAHPELRGADMVLTYVANNTDFATLVQSPSLYYPRFVRVDW